MIQNRSLTLSYILDQLFQNICITLTGTTEPTMSIFPGWLKLRVIKKNQSFAIQSLHFCLRSFASHTSLLPHCSAIYRLFECTHVWLIIWLSFTSLLYFPPLFIRFHSVHLTCFSRTLQTFSTNLNYSCSLFEYCFVFFLYTSLIILLTCTYLPGKTGKDGDK